MKLYLQCLQCHKNTTGESVTGGINYSSESSWMKHEAQFHTFSLRKMHKMCHNHKWTKNNHPQPWPIATFMRIIKTKVSVISPSKSPAVGKWSVLQKRVTSQETFSTFIIYQVVCPQQKYMHTAGIHKPGPDQRQGCQTVWAGHSLVRNLLKWT